MRQQCSARVVRVRQPAVVGSVLGALVCVALAVVAATAQSSFILGVFVGVDEARRADTSGGEVRRSWTGTNSWPSPDSEPVAINRLTRFHAHGSRSRPPRVWTTWKQAAELPRFGSGVSRIGGTGVLSGCTAAVGSTRPTVASPPRRGTLAFDWQRVEAVVDVTIPSDEASRIAGRLSELFTAAEEATLAARREWQFSLGSDGPRYPLSLPARDRASATIVLLKLYRAQKAAPGAPSIDR